MLKMIPKILDVLAKTQYPFTQIFSMNKRTISKQIQKMLDIL